MAARRVSELRQVLRPRRPVPRWRACLDEHVSLHALRADHKVSHEPSDRMLYSRKPHRSWLPAQRSMRTRRTCVHHRVQCSSLCYQGRTAKLNRRISSECRQGTRNRVRLYPRNPDWRACTVRVYSDSPRKREKPEPASARHWNTVAGCRGAGRSLARVDGRGR
jgi:hypothetical protein